MDRHTHTGIGGKIARTVRLGGNIIDFGNDSHDFQSYAKKNQRGVRRIEGEYQEKHVETVVLLRYSSNIDLILCEK